MTEDLHSEPEDPDGLEEGTSGGPGRTAGGLASIFHDWLYREGGRVTTLRWDRVEGRWDPLDDPWSRRHADELVARMMREHGVPRWRRRAAYLAVRVAGGRHWGG